MTNKEKFLTTLTAQYRELFAGNGEYAFSAKHTTPERLAEQMTTELLAGTASKDGEGIRNTCKILGIKSTYKAIVAYLNGTLNESRPADNCVDYVNGGGLSE